MSDESDNRDRNLFPIILQEDLAVGEVMGDFNSFPDSKKTHLVQHDV